MEARAAVIASANECTKRARERCDTTHAMRAMRWNRELNELEGTAAYGKRLAQIVELDPAFVHHPHLVR